MVSLIWRQQFIRPLRTPRRGNIPSGVLRYTAVEIGRRLAERGAIARAEDAVFLEEEELRAALSSGPPDLHDVVARWRAERG